MDTSEYMPMFLAEAREHLEQLNLVIVRLEEDPRDQATVLLGTDATESKLQGLAQSGALKG